MTPWSEPFAPSMRNRTAAVANNRGESELTVGNLTLNIGRHQARALRQPTPRPRVRASTNTPGSPRTVPYRQLG